MTRVFVSLVVALSLLPQLSFAAIPAVYTNDNYWISEHDQPAQLFRMTSGDFYGFTTTGKYFTQINIANEYHVRLNKFTIDRAYFYISDKGIIQADSDIAALSIYLAQNIS